MMGQFISFNISLQREMVYQNVSGTPLLAWFDFKPGLDE